MTLRLGSPLALVLDASGLGETRRFRAMFEMFCSTPHGAEWDTLEKGFRDSPNVCDGKMLAPVGVEG